MFKLFQKVVPLQPLSNDLLQQTQQLVSQRESQSEQDFCVGLMHLLMAQQNQFQNSHLLSEATCRFAVAIRQDRRSPWPYLGMARLLVAINEPQRAQGYLQSALKYAPEHPQIQAFLTALQTWSPQSALLFIGLETAAEMDLDQVYADVEALILQQVHKFMGQIGLLQPAFDAEQLRQWVEKDCQLEALFRDLEGYFLLLERELEIQGLKQLVLPLKPLKSRSQRNIQISRQILKLRQQLVETQAVAEDLHNWQGCDPDVNQNPDFQGELEILYDSCDQVADALDALEST